MAKRFTDTEKWKKAFFKSLQAPYKLVWLYLLDECNHAGVWEVEFDVMKLRTGISSSEKEIISVFGDRIIVFDEGKKWFIGEFIEFQYGELNKENRAHNSVIKLIDSYKKKGLTCPLQGAMDKDKDKIKGIVYDKYGLNELYKRIPNDDMQWDKYKKILKTEHKELVKLWKQFFLEKSANGSMFGKKENEILDHFINWSKTQEYKKTRL